MAEMLHFLKKTSHALWGCCVTLNAVLEISLPGTIQHLEAPESDRFTAIFSWAFLAYTVGIFNVLSYDIYADNATAFYQNPLS